MPCLAPSPTATTCRLRPPMQSYATIDQTDYKIESTLPLQSFVDSGGRRTKIKYAMSLDQGGSGGELHYFIPRSISPPRLRPPLQHGISFDQSNEEVESPDTPVLCDVETPVMSEVFRLLSHKSFGDSIDIQEPSCYKNRTNIGAAGPSSLSEDNYYSFNNWNDPTQIQRMSVTALFEKFCADERAPRPPIHQTSETMFRTNRLKGISADRISGGGGFVKKTRHDRISTSSLGDQPVMGSCFSVFDKRKNKMLSKLEKSKRLSTSALYDQSPTNNGLKCNRLRSGEFNKRFHSEELACSPADHAPSTSKSDNSVSRFKFYNENPLERASVARLLERFCDDTNLRHKQPSLDLSEPKSAKTEPYSAASLSERTSDIMSSTLFAIKAETPTIFNFDLETIQRETSENLSEILSPDQSASASNTVQLLFEDPRSNRTSISDLYEPCYSVSLSSKRPSLKRDLSRHWDLNTLDLRPIDDESPSSKFNSESSPDVLQFTGADADTDTRSNSFDVFDSTENQVTKTISSRTSMQKLEPFKPSVSNTDEDNDDGSDNEGDHETNMTVVSDQMAQLTLNANTNCSQKERDDMIRTKKPKDKDNVKKRTRCFPL